MARKNIPPEDHIEHIFYELRMVLGARNLSVIAEKNNWGNAGSYFKDSVYLHSRNLFTFFMARGKEGRNVQIDLFDINPFYSELFAAKEESLNRRVMHIGPQRPVRNETVEPREEDKLDKYIEQFVAELDTMSQLWIELTDDQMLKEELNKYYVKAHQEADNDRIRDYSALAKS